MVEMSDLTAAKTPMLGAEDAGAGVGGRDAVHPAWVDAAEEADDVLSRIKGKISGLERLHTESVGDVFGSRSGETEAKITAVTAEITRGFRQCERIVASLKGGGGEHQRQGAADARVRRNVQIRLATDLQAASLVFRRMQTEHLRRKREHSDPLSPGAGVGAQDGGLRVQGGGLGAGHFQDGGMQAQGGGHGHFQDISLMEQGASEAEVRRREKELSLIAGSVEDLAQIMKDLSTLVIEQGTVLDRIDYNVEHVQADVVRGVEELKKADNAQKKGTLFTCILVLLVLCIIMFGIIVFRHLV